MHVTDCRRPLQDKLALTIDDLVALGPAGRTTIYAEIKSGRLKSRVVAGRRCVLKSDYLNWVKGDSL